MSKKRLLVVIVALFLLASAIYFFSKRRADEGRARVYARVAHCESFAPNFTTYSQTFRPGILTNPQLDSLVLHYESLNPGLSEATVLSLLGKPTFTRADSSPEGANFYGCEWTYVLKAAGDNLLDSISVRFGEDGLTKEWSRMDQYGRAVK